jgi:Cu+-exporting ATPase
MKKDPICGMAVDEATALSAERDGEKVLLCSEHCRQKFLAQILPMPPASAKSKDSDHSHHGHEHAMVKPSAAAKYFCPMHPEVTADKPGSCPKCGMALERNLAWQPTKKHLHLPNAPGGRAGPSGQLSQVRHGTGAENHQRRYR